MDLDRPPRLAYAAALVALLSVPHLLAAVVGAAASQWETTGNWPVWFPELGSPGATLVGYAQFLDLLAYLVVPVLLFGLGVHYGRSRHRPAAGR